MKLLDLTNSPTLPTSSIQELIQKASEPLSNALKSEFDAFCDKHNLKVEEPLYGDYMTFKSYINQLERCSHCNGSDMTCTGKVVTVGHNGRLQNVARSCPVREALRLINIADVPFKFRDKRADSYTTTFNNTSAVLGAFRAITSGESLYIYGRAGCGKTLLSSIIINERAYKGLRSHFYTVTDMLDDLRDFSNPLRVEEKLLRLKKCPCLIIDDMGAENISDWVSTTLFSIIDSRYKNDLQTIVNSNFDIDSLCKRYVGYHGERIARRLRDMCKIIYIN